MTHKIFLILPTSMDTSITSRPNKQADMTFADILRDLTHEPNKWQVHIRQDKAPTFRRHHITPDSTTAETLRLLADLALFAVDLLLATKTWPWGYKPVFPLHQLLGGQQNRPRHRGCPVRKRNRSHG